MLFYNISDQIHMFDALKFPKNDRKQNYLTSKKCSQPSVCCAGLEMNSESTDDTEGSVIKCLKI